MVVIQGYVTKDNQAVEGSWLIIGGGVPWGQPQIIPTNTNIKSIQRSSRPSKDYMKGFLFDALLFEVIVIPLKIKLYLH